MGRECEGSGEGSVGELEGEWGGSERRSVGELEGE